MYHYLSVGKDRHIYVKLFFNNKASLDPSGRIMCGLTLCLCLMRAGLCHQSPARTESLWDVPARSPVSHPAPVFVRARRLLWDVPVWRCCLAEPPPPPPPPPGTQKANRWTVEAGGRWGGTPQVCAVLQLPPPPPPPLCITLPVLVGFSLCW